MPTFGICGPLSIAADARAAGWDYLEGSVQALFQGDLDDADWSGAAAIDTSALPVPIANLLLPGDLKIVGPVVDQERLTRYLERVFKRAAACGTQLLVFGAGGARGVPEGFDHASARSQIIEFLRLCGAHAALQQITLVIEPLNRRECNIINDVAEAMSYVRQVAHPKVKCLVDSYHAWLEKDAWSNVVQAGASIAHVHVADEVGRDAPGVTGQSDYRPFFRALKSIGYDGAISVESSKLTPERLESCLAFLKREWSAS